MKRASEIFGSVDPHLRVIDGGIRYKHRPNQVDWDKAGGTVCPRCKKETVRFRTQDNVCRQCADLLNEKEIRDEKKRAKFLRLMKSHNARIK